MIVPQQDHTFVSEHKRIGFTPLIELPPVPRDQWPLADAASSSAMAASTKQQQQQATAVPKLRAMFVHEATQKMMMGVLERKGVVLNHSEWCAYMDQHVKNMSTAQPFTAIDLERHVETFVTAILKKTEQDVLSIHQARGLPGPQHSVRAGTTGAVGAGI
jgi:hypothetical protein